MAERRDYGTGSLYITDGVWYGRWRTPDGRRPQRKIGKAKSPGKRDGISKQQAEAILREMIVAESSRAGARSQGAADPTIEELGRALVRRLTTHGRKPSHLESVRGHLNAHINPLLGPLPVSQVDERDVAQLIDRMIAKGKAPKTVRNVIGTLHGVFGLAMRERLITQNPCELADLPNPQRSQDIRFLTHEEIERVLAAAPSEDADQSERDQWPVVRLLILTATMTGMRLGELRALRWSDLDYGAMKIRIRQSYVRGAYGTPKSRRSARAVPLASRLMAELEAHHRETVWNQDSDLVLAHPHTGNPLHSGRTLKRFKAALERADVRPVRLHDLRHTFATTVAASGRVSLRTLQEWMGHTSITTTQIYADYMPGEREQEMIDGAFQALGRSQVEF